MTFGWVVCYVRNPPARRTQQDEADILGARKLVTNVSLKPDVALRLVNSDDINGALCNGRLLAAVCHALFPGNVPVALAGVASSSADVGPQRRGRIQRLLPVLYKVRAGSGGLVPDTADGARARLRRTGLLSSSANIQGGTHAAAQVVVVDARRGLGWRPRRRRRGDRRGRRRPRA